MGVIFLGGLFLLQVESVGVLADRHHAGRLLAVLCLESQPRHQQTPSARSGESWEMFDLLMFFFLILAPLFIYFLMRNTSKQIKKSMKQNELCVLLWRPAGRAFLAAERRRRVRPGGPRLESHTWPAAEEAGPRRRVEDRRLVLHRGSASKSGAHQLQVIVALEN